MTTQEEKIGRLYDRVSLFRVNTQFASRINIDKAEENSLSRYGGADQSEIQTERATRQSSQEGQWSSSLLSSEILEHFKIVLKNIQH